MNNGIQVESSVIPKHCKGCADYSLITGYCYKLIDRNCSLLGAHEAFNITDKRIAMCKLLGTYSSSLKV